MTANDYTASPKLCECGCGLPTTVSTCIMRKRGYEAGKPRRFRLYHHLKCRPLTNPTGYRKHWVEGQPRNVHILAVERALGHRLPPKAVVHHVDGNKDNNANRNLVVCQDHAYHMLLHARQRVIAAGGDPNTQRVCSSCRKPLDLSMFRVAPSQSTGRSSNCKACAAAYQREHAANLFAARPILKCARRECERQFVAGFRRKYCSVKCKSLDRRATP